MSNIFNNSLDQKSFGSLSKRARRRLLKMHYETGVGHIGGNLSSIDSMLYLHHAVMCPEDAFVLSKGHSVGALYITLWTLSVLSDDDLQTFHQDNTLLAGHPVPGFLPQIPFATGSLGHGFPVSCGMALARKKMGKPGNIYCFCSDGEWQEGSNWEALIFSRHHDLSNLVLLVDVNGLQGFGTTRDVASMSDLHRYFESFDFEVIELAGHSYDSLNYLSSRLADRRRVFLLNTVKGKGIPSIEGIVASHYLPISKELFLLAMEELRE